MTLSEAKLSRMGDLTNSSECFLIWGMNDQAPTSGVYEKDKGGASKILMLIIMVAVLVLLGFLGFLLKDKFTKTEEALSPTPTPAGFFEEPIITPTPEVLDRSKYTLRILNGTKTSGLAASVSGKLKDLGYIIDKTGNATNSAFPQTLVRAKGDIADLIKQLTSDLSPNFEAEEGVGLEDSDTVDVEIILGIR